MVEKKDEVIKEAETILRQFLIKQNIDVILKEPSQDKFVLEEHATVSGKKKDQSTIPYVPTDVPSGQKDHPSVETDPVRQEAAKNTTVNQEINDYIEANLVPFKMRRWLCVRRVYKGI